MRIQIICTLLLFFIINSCNKPSEESKQGVFVPRVIEARGRIVHYDSTAVQKMAMIDKPKKNLAGKPSVISINTNIHPAGFPAKVIAGKPRICIPGRDTFLRPKIVPAIDSPFLAELPKVVVAEKANIKDPNPYSFNSFSKLQGLNDNGIRCMILDHLGNIWFGTDGGGVSKYDGKFFTNFTIKEGLKNNVIRCILQDRKGNIWLGTDGGGVTKYDGKSITNFTEKEGLSSNRIYSILQDKNGCLWFGTYGGGVVKYDGKSFTHYTMKEGLCHDVIRSILQDNKGNLWFGSDGGGVSQFDGTSFTTYTEKEGLGNNFIWSILQDNNGNLWFGTYKDGVSKFDGKYFTNYTEKEGLSSNYVYCMLQDKTGNIWIGTYGGGVSKYDGTNFTHFAEKEGLSNNFVFSILQDRNENIWIGTDGGGLSKYNGELFTHLNEEKIPSNNYIVNVIKDRDNNIWFGTDGDGVLKYDGKSFVHFTEKEGLSSNIIMSMLQDQKGDIWFCHYGVGITVFDGKYFTRYTENDGLNDYIILSILQDKAGNIWFGTTSNGVLKFDGKYLSHYTEKEGFCNASVIKIIQDKNQNLWFATLGCGLIKFDGKDFVHFTTREGLSNNNILTLYKDRIENLWLGTDGGGVIKYDGCRVESINNGVKIPVQEQKDLLKVDGKLVSTFTCFSENEGLSGNIVKSIIEDTNENLWFGTHVGLSKLSKENLARYYGKSIESVAGRADKISSHQTLLFKNYTYEDGFLGVGCSRNAIIEDKNGTIWIGANSKLTAYHPGGDKIDTIPPNIQLMGIDLFNENIPWTCFEQKIDTSIVLENGITVSDFSFDYTTNWYGLPVNLSLRHNNNFITFKYIGIKLKQSNNVMYQYKLDGLEDHWSQPTLRNEANYGNLSPGKYTFKVKAMNGDGYWSNEFDYTFTIRPPWWKTLFFKILAVVLTILTLISLYSWRVASFTKQQKLLEQTVKEKTAEVVQHNLEIKEQNIVLEHQKSEIQTQRNELEIANATKDKFFSIIAHDLRNPINSVLGLAGVLVEALPTMKMEKIERIALIMRDSSASISHLLENLLQWARMQQGLFHFDLNLIELLPIVDESITSVYETARNKGIEIFNNIPFDLVVYADGNVLQMVIRNILSNAIKFTNRGGTVSLSADSFNIGFVEISIKDTGIGMSDELIGNLFRLDLQTNRRGTEGEPSTGLGLIICKDFIEKQGGKLWVESIEGVGSTFRFSIPKMRNH